MDITNYCLKCEERAVKSKDLLDSFCEDCLIKPKDEHLKNARKKVQELIHEWLK